MAAQDLELLSSIRSSALARDAKLDVEGLRNVLALRAESTGQLGRVPPPPEKYLELGPYERAIARLK